MKYLILVLLIIGSITRFTLLSHLPAGFTPDEAAFGYNAYSLFNTGYDEWGTPFWQLPVLGLRSFGDYKLPLYALLSVPSVLIFGMNEFGIRFPNALLSVLGTVTIYTLAARLAGKKAGIFAAFFATISIWYVSLSRGAFEANLVTFFLSLGLSLILSRRHILGSLILALGMYSYHTARLITPPIFFLALFMFVPRTGQKKAALVFTFLIIPAAVSLMKFNSRSADLSIFNPADHWERMATARLEAINSGWPGWAARMVHNKINYSAGTFIDNYRTYSTPGFLLAGPGEPTYGMIPGSGMIYPVELILLASSLVFFLRHRPRYLFLILGILLISPVAASLTKGAGMAGNRTSPMMIPIFLMSSIGLIYIEKSLFRYGRIFIYIFFLVLIVSFGQYINRYLLVFPNMSAHAMGYGWDKATPVILSESEKYSQVRVSRSLSEPHIYLAFYGKLNPRDYQTASQSWSGFEKAGFRFLDQYDGYTLGKFRFGDLNFDKPVLDATLYVGRENDFPPGTPLKIIARYPDLSSDIVLAEKSANTPP